LPLATASKNHLCLQQQLRNYISTIGDSLENTVLSTTLENTFVLATALKIHFCLQRQHRTYISAIIGIFAIGDRLKNSFMPTTATLKLHFYHWRQLRKYSFAHNTRKYISIGDSLENTSLPTTATAEIHFYNS
jgi:hypothetical protein